MLPRYHCQQVAPPQPASSTASHHSSTADESVSATDSTGAALPSFSSSSAWPSAGLTTAHPIDDSPADKSARGQPATHAPCSTRKRGGATCFTEIHGGQSHSESQSMTSVRTSSSDSDTDGASRRLPPQLSAAALAQRSDRNIRMHASRPIARLKVSSSAPTPTAAAQPSRPAQLVRPRTAGELAQPSIERQVRMRCRLGLLERDVLNNTLA